MAMVSFTEAECQALYDLISQLSGNNPENAFANDGTDDIGDPATRAAAKLFSAAGHDVPANLRNLVASVDTLALPHGLLSTLKSGHLGLRGVSLPRPITLVMDLCDCTARELTAQGVLWDRGIEDIRAALAKVGLKLKGE